jgi:hypothetical protein
MKRRHRIIATSAALAVLAPSLAFADGGGPLLLLISLPLFTLGQVWILASEWIVLRRKLPVDPLRLLKWVVGANLISAAVCSIGLPLIWAGVTAAISYLAQGTEFAGIALASGSWIVGDNSPYPNLALAATAVGLIATFFPTFWVEWRLIRRWASSDGETPEGLRGIVLVMNAISYLGLVLLSAGFVVLDRVLNAPGI